MRPLNKPASQRRRGRPSLKQPVKAREALLRSALKVFSEEGFKAASVRQIASACSVDPALIKHHFGSKQELWHEVVDYLAQVSQTHREQQVSDLNDKQFNTRQSLEFIIGNFVRLTAEIPEMSMFIANEATKGGERLHYLVEKLIKPFYLDFLPFIKTGIKEGELNAQDPKLFYFTLVNAVAMPLAFPGLLNQFSGPKVGTNEFNHALIETILAIFIAKEQ